MSSSPTEKPPLPADPPGEEDAAGQELPEAASSPKAEQAPAPAGLLGKKDAAEKEAAERRSAPRKLVHWRVRLMHESASGQVASQGKAIDASMAGMSLLCDENLVVSTRLVVAVALPVPKNPQSVNEVHVSATVVNAIYTQGGFRIGLQFTKFHAKAKEALAASLA